MELKGRLKAIANQIPHCSILADVGTDHAYIPIYAVKNNLCKRALAADLRPGPLKRASANIGRYGLTDRIETRLGDGLEPILLHECDTVTIAGMGGVLIRDILSASLVKAQAAETLLLQPNNAVEALRKWLYESGFDIMDEIIAFDAGKLYCIIKARWLNQPCMKDEFAYYIGEKIFEGNELYLDKYLLKKLKELEVIIEGRALSVTEKECDVKNGVGLATKDCIFIRDKLVEYLKRSEDL